jgi:hypothetical protein
MSHERVPAKYPMARPHGARPSRHSHGIIRPLTVVARPGLVVAAVDFGVVADIAGSGSA